MSPGMPAPRALPPPPFLRVLLVRASVFWLLGRLILVIFGVREPFPAIARIGTPTSVGLIGLVAALTLFESHRRHEVVFLANLGVGRARLLAVGVLPPLILELATCLISG